MSEMEIVFLLLVGQLQDARSYAPTGSSEQWVPFMDLHSLLPVCALSPPTLESSTHDRWTTVETHSHGHSKSQQFVGQTIFGVKSSQFTGSRCAELHEDMDQAFSASNAEHKEHAPKSSMSAFGKGVRQAAFKSVVKKKKKSNNEHRSFLTAAVHEGVNDVEFTRRPDEIGQECWAEATNVKADARLEQRHISCHDPLLNVKPLNTDAKEWHMLSPAVDEGTAEPVIPDLLNDHPICETQASRNGLNYIAATGELRRATITLITRVSSWTQSCIRQLWLARLEQRHQRKSIGCARKW